MSENAASDLERLRQLTRRMLELAEAGEWETLAETEAERRPLILVVFQGGPDGPAASPEERETLGQELLDADKRIVELARAGMTDLKTQLQGLHEGSKANQAYQSVQDMGESD